MPLPTAATAATTITAWKTATWKWNLFVMAGRRRRNASAVGNGADRL